MPVATLAERKSAKAAKIAATRAARATQFPASKGAARSAKSEMMDALAASFTSPDGTTFALGKSCITCFRPQVAFPSNQLPSTSPKYPQCSECLDFEYRRIARIEAGQS